MIHHFKKVARPRKWFEQARSIITSLLIFALTILPIGNVFLRANVASDDYPFIDVTYDHLNSEAISYLMDVGVLGGYPDGSFKADRSINRAEFVKIIVNSKYKTSEIDNCDVNNPSNLFLDIPNDAWYKSFVCVAKTKGLISGYDDGEFKGANPINFVEAAKIIVNAQIEKTDPGNPWYQPFVEKLESKKAIPYSIQAFNKTISRAEVSEIYYRLLSNHNDKLSLTYDEIRLIEGGIIGIATAGDDCFNRTDFEVMNFPDFATKEAKVKIKNTGIGTLTENGECALKFYNEYDNPLPVSFSAIAPGTEQEVSIPITANRECELKRLKIKADRIEGLEDVTLTAGSESECSNPYWYTVINGWEPSNVTNKKLWGGVFNKKQYSENALADTLFAKKSGDSAKELVVEVIGTAQDYDENDANTVTNKKSMAKDYRTDRWYKIKYENPSDLGTEKVGYVPVSALIKKDTDLFEMTDGNANYLFRNTSAYVKYNGDTLVCEGGSYRGDEPMSRVILHNTGGSSVLGYDNTCSIHYYLARDDKSYGDKLIIRVPEYQTTESASDNDAENEAISIEMVNWEWANPALDSNDYNKRIISNNVFNSFDFDKIKGDYDADNPNKVNHFVEISGDKYDIINYYFQDKDGFLELLNYVNSTADKTNREKNESLLASQLPLEGKWLRSEFLSDKAMFDNYYIKGRSREGNDAYILKRNFLDLVMKSGISNSEKAEFDSLYLIFNKIPLNHKFYTYLKTEIDYTQLIYPKHTYPFNVYQREGSVQNQKLSDGRDSDYYEKFTNGQYQTLEKFFVHMNEKYNISLRTFNYDFGDNTPQKYGFYYQESNSYLINNLARVFNGIVSHRDTRPGGKMCPSPGFQIDRIPALRFQE